MSIQALPEDVQSGTGEAKFKSTSSVLEWATGYQIAIVLVTTSSKQGLNQSSQGWGPSLEVEGREVPLWEYGTRRIQIVAGSHLAKSACGHNQHLTGPQGNKQKLRHEDFSGQVVIWVGFSVSCTKGILTNSSAQDTGTSNMDSSAINLSNTQLDETTRNLLTLFYSPRWRCKRIKL